MSTTRFRTISRDGARLRGMRGIGPFELVFEIFAGDDGVPSHVIEMGTKATERTIVQDP